MGKKEERKHQTTPPMKLSDESVLSGESDESSEAALFPTLIVFLMVERRIYEKEPQGRHDVIGLTTINWSNTVLPEPQETRMRYFNVRKENVNSVCQGFMPVLLGVI